MNSFPRNKPGAIVIGGDYRGLGVVRSLGRRGIPVWVLTDEHILAAQSRYCRRRFNWPRRGPEQIRLLLELAEILGASGWTLFPTGDEAAAFISRNHSTLRDAFVLTTPPMETFRWTCDKASMHQVADRVNVPHPATFIASNRSELELHDFTFPVILKPSNKHRPSRFTRDKAWLATNRAELSTRYDDACSMLDPKFIMVQELLPLSANSEFSFAALVSDGLPIASLVARRTRQYPIVFGKSSSFVQAIEEPEVEHLAVKLLRAMRFSGLVEVEFKRDVRDSTLKVLDVNARVWGWHTLGARAGVDFAYLAWRFANGLSVARERGRSGVAWVRATTDLLALGQYLRTRQLSLRSYLRSLHAPLEFAIWAKDDPIPSLLEIPALLHARRKVRRSLRDAQHLCLLNIPKASKSLAISLE